MTDSSGASATSGANMGSTVRKPCVLCNAECDGRARVKDPQGRYVFVNRPVRELWRASLDEAIGADDSRFFDAASCACACSSAQRACQDALNFPPPADSSTPEPGSSVDSERLSLWTRFKGTLRCADSYPCCC